MEKKLEFIAKVLKKENRAQLCTNDDFQSYGVHEDIVLSMANFKTITKVAISQAQALPYFLETNENLCIAMSCGYGKTLLYAIGAVTKVDTDKKYPQVLCVCSTYEAALQTALVLSRLSIFKDVKVGVASQEIGLAAKMDVQHCHIIVGAPADIIGFKTMRLFNIEDISLCVLDDADKIYTTEIFQKQILKPLVSRQSSRIVMLASQEFRPPLVRNYQRIENLDNPNVKQYFLQIHDIADKLQAVILIYKMLKGKNSKGIVFCQENDMVENITNFFFLKKMDVLNTNASLSMEERRRRLGTLQEKKVTMIVTTNLLARALDIDSLRVVINFDLPKDKRTNMVDKTSYVYRIGRCSRFGLEGIVVNLITPNELHQLRDLQQHHDIAEIK